MEFLKRTKTFGFLGIALGVAALAVIALRFTSAPTEEIPLPFGLDQSSVSLAGSVSQIGVKHGISVQKVLFPDGTDSETLGIDSLYLVTVPDDVNITSVPLDDAFTTDAGPSTNYFGYKYTSADAALEKTHKGDTLLTDRFPGQFFASAKARSEDAVHGEAIATFESTNGIHMDATDTATGALLTKNSLYFIIVNEESGATLTVRHPATGPRLTVTQRQMPTTKTAVSSETGAELFCFVARASAEGTVLLTDLKFAAATGYSLANAQNYTLWVDSDDDNEVDTILQQGVASESGTVTFDSLIGGGWTVSTDHDVKYEVHAAIASSLIGSNPELALRFDTGSTFIQAEETSDGTPLAGIHTLSPVGTVVASNGSYVDGGTAALIDVSMANPTTYLLSHQGDLFVSKSATPVRARQLLAGTLESEILRLQFSAHLEDADVTNLVFTASGSDAANVATNVDRLELYKAGDTTPFTVATIGGCGTQTVPDNSYCAVMNAQELIAAKDSNTSVIVRPRMKTDVDGAVSGTQVAFYLDPLPSNGAVQARGVTSSNVYSENNGDFAADGEVVIGASNPAPNEHISGKLNDVVLAKIDTIANANPNADGTSVPTGVAPIGQFKFTTLANANTQNDLNKFALSDVIFTVDAANVQFDDNGFQIYNKADAGTKSPCIVLDSASTDPTFTVACWSIRNAGVNTDIASANDATFVLESTILNPLVSSDASSSLKVSLQSFSDSTLAGMAQSLSHIGWLDTDVGASHQFFWVESPETVVNSTQYNTVVTPPVCGNGAIEGTEACDDGDQINTNMCTNQCTVAICGDGIASPQNSEECDDGNQTANDGCSNICSYQMPLQSVQIQSADYNNIQVTLAQDIGSVYYIAHMYSNTGADLGSQATLASGNTTIFHGIGDDMSAAGLTDYHLEFRMCPLMSNGTESDNCGAVSVLDIHFVMGRALCGDGNRDDTAPGTEQCDDGNTTAGDGCSDICSVESGYSCNTATPNVCTPDPVCGNGAIETPETCDDSNTADGDGCSATCAIETDYRCTGEPSTCQSYLNYVKALADTNTDGTVSDNEALALTLAVADAPDQPYNTVSQYDIDNDGDVDNTDIAIILAQLDILAPTP